MKLAGYRQSMGSQRVRHNSVTKSPQYTNVSICYVPIIGLVESKILFQETNRINNSLVEETYTLTLHIVYVDKFKYKNTNFSIYVQRKHSDPRDKHILNN